MQIKCKPISLDSFVMDGHDSNNLQEQHQQQQQHIPSSVLSPGYYSHSYPPPQQQSRQHASYYPNYYNQPPQPAPHYQQQQQWGHHSYYQGQSVSVGGQQQLYQQEFINSPKGQNPYNPPPPYVQQQQQQQSLQQHNGYGHNNGNGTIFVPSSASSCHHNTSNNPSRQQIVPNVVVASSSSGGNIVVPPCRMQWTAPTSSSELSGYPGGLEIVWREVSEDCQKLLTHQDIPDSAKYRGYFTVCEMLALKRCLVERLESGWTFRPKVPRMAATTSEELPEQEQEFGSSQRLQASLRDEPYPVGVPLVAKFKQGFAYKTIGHRLPVILTKVIDQLSRDKNEIGDNLGTEARDEVKLVVGSLAKLKNEMQTNKTIPKINCPLWDDYRDLIAKRYFEGKTEEVKWYFVPWLYAECYMYRRLFQAFQETKFLKDYDVFRKQKEESWAHSVKPAEGLAEFIKKSEHTEEFLEEMMEISLWGNRCDLSISSGETNSANHHDIVDQLQELKKFILCDDATSFWSRIKKYKEDGQISLSVGYILDNAGFELFTDLCFADTLMSKVDRVDFHVKMIPWFVSDALTHDFHWLLDSMCAETESPILVELGQKWKGHVSSGRWRIMESQFWTYPHAFYEMATTDPKLYSILQENSLLIFKGDLNYRKLIGDVNWNPETPFSKSLQGFGPSPLVALRTLKADCVSGLKAGLATQIAGQNSDWMVTGEYGVIQYSEGSL